MTIYVVYIARTQLLVVVCCLRRIDHEVVVRGILGLCVRGVCGVCAGWGQGGLGGIVFEGRDRKVS